MACMRIFFIKTWSVWAVLLEKPLKSCLKNRSNLLRGFWAVFYDKPLKTVQMLRVFWRFFWINRSKTTQTAHFDARFCAQSSKKPLKPLKSCFKLGEKSRLGLAYFLQKLDPPENGVTVSKHLFPISADVLKKNMQRSNRDIKFKSNKNYL